MRDRKLARPLDSIKTWSFSYTYAKVDTIVLWCLANTVIQSNRQNVPTEYEQVKTAAKKKQTLKGVPSVYS